MTGSMLDSDVVDRVYRRLDGGNFGSTSKDCIRAVLHATGCDTDTPNQEVTMDGAALIAAERQRQVDAEGYDSAHDDQHDEGELRRAAVCYVQSGPPVSWPWEPESFKRAGRGGRIKDLVRAGALLAAEIDRLQRGGRDV